MSISINFRLTDVLLTTLLPSIHVLYGFYPAIACSIFYKHVLIFLSINLVTNSFRIASMPQQVSGSFDERVVPERIVP